MKTIAKKTDFLDYPHHHKAHKTPVPLLGGVAIFGTLLIVSWGGILMLFLITKISLLEFVIPVQLHKYIGGIFLKTPQLLSVFGGATVLSIFGLIDDKKDLRALTRIVVQIFAASIVFCAGIRITLFSSHLLFSYLLTVIWLVAVINSFNLLDNMDGLSSGIACIAGGIFLLLSIVNHQYFVSLFLAAYVGSILGFLIYNFSPASIYMGDAGSMVIGFFMGVLTILGTYYYPEFPTVFPIAMPLVILSVPFYDVISVILIRSKNRKPIYIGDRNHFSHRLVRLGMTEQGAVLLIYILTFATGISSLLLQMVEFHGVIIILFQVVLFLFIIGLLEYYGKKKEFHEISKKTN
ncbi:MraY family glycosyltransferase [Chlamydiota bacterium]